MSLTKGQVIEFQYQGGSTPGAKRTVVVNVDAGSYVGGTDLETGEYRNFSVANMKQSEVVPSVTLDLAPFDSSSRSSMVEIYRKTYEKQGYRVDAYGNSLVAYKPVRKLCAAFSAHGCAFSYGHKSFAVSKDYVGNNELTLDNLIEALQRLKS